MKIEYVVFFQFGCALFVCLGAAPSAGIESYIPTFRTFPQSTGGITQLKIQKPYPYPPPAYPPPYRPPPTQYVPIPYPMYSNQGGGSQVHRRIESYQTTQSNPGLRMMGYGGFMLFGFFAMMFMMFFFILMFGMISGGGNSVSSNDLLLASALGGD